MLYSGNIGMKQGLDLIVEAAARVEGARLIVCGDGAARPALEALIAARNLDKLGNLGNVTLLPLQPDEDYRRMMADADVCVISQRAGGGAAFFPSKLLSCVALGKPVLAVAEAGSELARVVREEGLGLWVAPEVDAVTEMMRGLARSRGQLDGCAEKGRKFAERYEEERVLREFEEVLGAVGRG
jgi:colanic acid biosynthesis glycosyl transferase WcaI